MGAIPDRSKEFLVASDKAVIAMCRMMLEASYAVERREQPPGLDPESYRTVRPRDSVIPLTYTGAKPWLRNWSRNGDPFDAFSGVVLRF